MGLLGRFREYWPWTKEEQQFDKVMIGENYCGKLRDEWSDAPSDPLESKYMMKSDKKTKSSSRSRKPVFTEVSSIDKERTVRFKSAAAEGSKSKEGERKFPVQRSSHEDVNDLRSVLESLARLGEELIPLLLTLSKMGEEMYGATAASHHQAGEALSTSTSAIEAAKRPAATPTSSTQSERGSSNTITESNKNTNKSRSNPSASRKSSQDSSTTSSMTHATPPTPTTSSSNGSAAPSSQLSKGSTQEEAAFGAFKGLCAIHGLLKRPVGTGEHDVCDGINDEATLRRFFHARKRDVSEAYRQFKEACDAREANQICAFYESIDIHHFEETRNLYPHWTGRLDKRGQPLCMFDFGKLDSKTMAAYKKSSTEMDNPRSNLKLPGIVSTEMLRAFAVYEHLTRFIMPLCTAASGNSRPEEAITKMLCVVDISGIGVKQVWNLRGYLQDLSKLFATNYPEILDKVFIIGAPSYFPTIWGWIKKWVDPNTVAKLNIVAPEEVMSILKEHINISDIPKRFGGDFEYQHGMQPDLDSMVADLLTWVPPNASLPMGPLKWVNEGKGKRGVIAVGSCEGREKGEKIASLKGRTRERK